MGQAKLKSEKREAQARHIIAAFENFIVAVLRDERSDQVEDRVLRTEYREELVKALTALPPK